MAGATAVALLTTGAGPASADSITIDYLTCTSGDSRFYCTLGFSGGAAPHAVGWAAVNGTVTESSESEASGPCTTGLKVKVTATVTDATGAAATRSATTPCRKVWP
jgi:hypothetical protein